MRLLEDWDGYPGAALPDGVARDAAVLAWARAVLHATRHSGRASGGIFMLAKVLERVPSALDGHWPSLAVRQLLEDETEDERPLAVNLVSARLNSRGMTTRETAEGGFQESALAQSYRIAATDLRRRGYPKTADLSIELARRFDIDAWHEDSWSSAVSRVEGISRDGVETSLRKLQAADIAIALCLALRPALERGDVVERLGLGQEDVIEGLGRLGAARIFDADEGAVSIARLLEVLRGDLAEAFPCAAGPEENGVATGVDAVPALAAPLSDTRKRHVWSFNGGTAFGVTVRPLCPRAPLVASDDRALYQALALVDAIRVGTAEERSVARDGLRSVLSARAPIPQLRGEAARRRVWRYDPAAPGLTR